MTITAMTKKHPNAKESMVSNMTTHNNYTERSKLLKVLRMSLTRKTKNRWSKNIGAGFIRDDIKSVTLSHKKHTWNIFFIFEWGEQLIPVQDLNRRETQETISFLEQSPTH